MKIDFDSIVKTLATAVTEKNVQAAIVEVECQVDGPAWCMNRRLNMIAYEDQH